MTVGERIKELREIKNLSQNKLSKLADISQSTLSYIENGTQVPNIETIGMIAQALNVSLSYLLGEKEGTSNDSALPPKIESLVKIAFSLPSDKLNTLIETAKAML